MCKLIKMSRLEASQLKPFIRRVQVTQEPSFIVASGRQLNDLVPFCTTQFLPASGLCIDTTFNIGNFFVTSTTYKHKILVDRHYGKEPTLFGADYDPHADKGRKLQVFRFVDLSPSMMNEATLWRLAPTGTLHWGRDFDLVSWSLPSSAAKVTWSRISDVSWETSELASFRRNLFWKIHMVRRQKNNLALLMLSVAMSLMLSLNRYMPYGQNANWRLGS